MAARKARETEFVLTISDSEEDVPDLDDETDNEDPTVKVSKKSKKKMHGNASDDEATDLNKDFLFSVDGDNADSTNFDGWDFASKDNEGKKLRRDVDLDDIIRRRGGLGTLVGVEKESSSEEEEEEEEEPASGDQDELAMDGFGMGNQSQAKPEEEEEEAEDQEEEESGGEEIDASDNETNEKPDQDTVEEMANFYGQEEKTDSQVHKSFNTLQLSRPVLKGLSALGYSTPSPIQSASIPIALLGKDIVAGAVTGSGKTAAYMIPIIERLLYKPSKVATSRVIIMTPTRELAIQVADVGRKLAQFVSGISFGLAVGGLNLRQQEAQLKTRPDIVIATPGRLIDHIRNSPSFSVDAVEVLVVDEADRMLEEGFQQELTEILSLIPQKRQTLLFSATMNSRIKDLIQLSLKRPVRIMINPPKQAASGLIQEFVRIRKRDALKPALLYSVLTKIDAKQQNRTLVFVATKETAHRLRVILGLLGLKVSELHGSLSQEQRLNNVTDFKNLTVPILICTDLASRGLDIPKIEVVINFDMPKSHEIYLHRIGRTARAGREGRSITFVGESSAERAIVKEAIKSIESSKDLNKHFKGKAVGRNVDWTQVEQFNKVIHEKESLIEDVLNEEKEEKEILIAEMQLNKGENLLRHKDEIRSRPKRTWFQSEGEKKAEKKAKKLNSKQRKVREEREEGGKVYSKTKADRDNDKHRSYTKQKAKAQMKKQKKSRK